MEKELCTGLRLATYFVPYHYCAVLRFELFTTRTVCAICSSQGHTNIFKSRWTLATENNLDTFHLTICCGSSACRLQLLKVTRQQYCRYQIPLCLRCKITWRSRFSVRPLIMSPQTILALAWYPLLGYFPFFWQQGSFECQSSITEHSAVTRKSTV